MAQTVLTTAICMALTLSLHFNGHFSRWTDFIEDKDGGSGGGNWSYKTCKAPVKSSPATNQHPVFTGWMPFLFPTISVRALNGDQRWWWLMMISACSGPADETQDDGRRVPWCQLRQSVCTLPASSELRQLCHATSGTQGITSRCIPFSSVSFFP